MAIRSFKIQLGLGVLALFVSLPALAGQREDIARTEVAAATAAYNLGYYEDAARHYEEAYRQVSDPALLFNIGQAYRLAGKPDRAITAYRAYLRTAPADAANRGQVEKRIPELEKLVEQMKSEQTAPPGGTLPTAPPATAPPAQFQGSAPAFPPATPPPAVQVQGSVPAWPPAAPPPAAPPAQWQGSAPPAAAPPLGAEAARQGASNMPVAPSASSWPAPPYIQPTPAAPQGADLRAPATAPAAESPPLYTRWWFWTGLGVVVAGAVVGVVAYAFSSGSSNGGVPSTTLGNQPIF